MMRLSRIGSFFVLAFWLSLPICWSVARADDSTPPAANVTPPAGGDTTAAPAPADNGAAAPAPTDSGTAAPAPTDSTAGASAPQAEPQIQPTLVDLVDTYWHYGKVARYDLAADAGKKILDANADSGTVLVAFETVTERKNDNIDTWMLRWRSLPVNDAPDQASVQAMRDVSNKLLAIINDGYATRRADPHYIQETIAEMSKGARAYDNNLPRLSQSGELAVKIIIDILRDPDQRDLHATCRQILRDLGRKALNPLLAATEMKDYDTLVDVISALGDIGYDAALPYLARLAVDPEAPEAIRNASRTALFHIGVARSSSLRPSDLFYILAEKCYYGRSDIEPAGDKISYIWYWTSDLGLERKQVPTAIFNDLLAMRAAEYAMKLNAANSQAVSLWLAANTKREADLPAGAVDLTHKGDPDANYYNVSAGATYLNVALDRALRDRDAAVALRLCDSLRNITGLANLNGDEITPLMQALFFPNRQVRYAAAFALAQSLPSKSFSGSDRVVPLLVEAVNQTSKPGVVIVAPTTSDTLSATDLRDAVMNLGYPVIAANDPAVAATASLSLPTVDLVIISEDSDVRKMIDLEQTISHLQGVSMLVLTHNVESPYAVASATDLLMNAAVMPAKASLKDELGADIDAARQHSGTAVMSEEEASGYALDAASLLEKLAITRGHALDVSVAEAGLLAALSDSRPAIAKAAGKVLGTLTTISSQNGLAMKANSDATPSEVRVSLYESLADSAKHIGNHLDPSQVEILETVVSQSKDPGVRDAAAQARGALDLPAAEARTLILKQSRV